MHPSSHACGAAPLATVVMAVARGAGSSAGSAAGSPAAAAWKLTAVLDASDMSSCGSASACTCPPCCRCRTAGPRRRRGGASAAAACRCAPASEQLPGAPSRCCCTAAAVAIMGAALTKGQRETSWSKPPAAVQGRRWVAGSAWRQRRHRGGSSKEPVQGALASASRYEALSQAWWTKGGMQERRCWPGKPWWVPVCHSAGIAHHDRSPIVFSTITRARCQRLKLRGWLGVLEVRCGTRPARPAWPQRRC